MLIVYAHREEEGAAGWEAMLTALVESNLQIVGTWPIEAARADRLRTVSSNALAAYIVLVCRPLGRDAPRISLREFDRELRERLRGSVKELQEAATAPVDLAQAVIGPGMAVFSRHSAVLTSDGAHLTVGEALVRINRALAEILDEQDSDLDAESRFAVTWFEQHGNEEGSFGEADQLARAKNVAVDGLVQAGIIESRGGKVRMLLRSELDPVWVPGIDRSVTVWEVCQQLVRRLALGGELAAAELFVKVGAEREAARELAYRLFTICERKKLPKEAVAYNSLVVAWPEIARLSTGAGARTPTQQGML
jgi:putative DNA methylase